MLRLSFFLLSKGLIFLQIKSLLFMLLELVSWPQDVQLRLDFFKIFRLDFKKILNNPLRKYFPFLIIHIRLSDSPALHAMIATQQSRNGPHFISHAMIPPCCKSKFDLDFKRSRLEQNFVSKLKSFISCTI